jgi:hypothetical protein
MAKISPCSRNPQAAESSTSKQAEATPSVAKVKESWREWNTSSSLSSSQRQNLKIKSLESLAKELVKNDEAASDKVERVTQDFFGHGLDKSINGVQTLLNHYCNFVDQLSADLVPLADEQLVSNTWRSS